MRLARLNQLLTLFGSGAIAVTCVAGCVEVAKTNLGETVYRNSQWFGATMIALGLVAAAFGIRLIRNEQRAIRWLGGLILLFGALFAGGVGPSPYFDELRVAHDYFYLDVGFWFARNIHRVDYASVEHVDLTSEVHANGRNRSVSYYMQVYRNDKSHEEVPIGDLMKEALDEILGHFKRLKIPVHDLRKD